MNPEYVSYRLGITLRLATALLIEIIGVIAFFCRVIHLENLIGISASVGFIVLMAVPFFFIMRAAIEADRPKPASAFDRLFILIGYSGVIYSVGGIEAGYLVSVYLILLIYYVVATNRKMPYLTSTMSLVCFSAFVFLEYFGALPHLSVIKRFHAPLDYQVTALVITAIVLYVGAFTASYAAKIVERSRAELRARNRELEIAKDRAQESDRLKSEFLAHMSHELRTPLHHVIGFTEIVLEEAGCRLEASQREALGDVLRSGRHLLSLINDVLDVAQVESGKLVLSEGAVDVRALLEGSLTVIQDVAQKRCVAVGLQLCEARLSVRGDERRLRQVLYNLLSNAVKFTPPGGKVVLSAERTEECLLISVRDTGIGLSRDDLERIFLPFERVHGKERFRYPGTGLGLSLARKYVELHGGRIWAESDGERQGATFRFTIPISRLVVRSAG